MHTILLPYPGHEDLTQYLAQEGDLPIAETTIKHFPDGESYFRVLTPIEGARVLIICSLDQPNSKLLQVLLLAKTAKDLGAKRVELVAPYLSYMRQDERFHPGEGITSAYVAELISQSFDALWTMAPHLHRHDDLSNIYTIPTICLDPAPAIAQWVHTLDNPLLIGPDDESEQWVQAVAQHHDTPYIIFDKVRRGDRDVELFTRGDIPHGKWTPVIIDDIISTGHTMARAVACALQLELGAPFCLGVHAVFADDATTLLLNQGAREVLTCNTISHTSNAVDIFPMFTAALHPANTQH